MQRIIPIVAGIFFMFVFGTHNTAISAPATQPTLHAPRSTALDAAELINESGRLRMLSERMGKAYAQIALNVLPGKAREQIAQSQKKFEENLVLLGKGGNTPELKAGLDAVTALYRQYAKLLAKPADKTTVPAVHLLTDQLVAEAEKLTAAFDAQTRAPTARIVNISGRQRMLSQRMARLYFAEALGGSKTDTGKYRIEFKNALATIEAAPLTSNEIKREIDLAKSQWLFFEQALTGTGDPVNGVRNVATTSERLLEIMDNLTALYSKALKSVIE